MRENHLQALPTRLFSKSGLVLILVFVVSFAIRVLRLDFYSLWYDETNTVSLFQDKSVMGAFAAVLSTSGSETLHPLYYLILSAWMQIAGNSEAAIRLPSVIFGSLAGVVYACLLYQVGGAKALRYGLLLTISPFLMWYSRDARPYALIMFFTGLHLLLYLKLLAKPRSKSVLAGFVLTGVLMVYSGILTGMLLIAELIWSLFFRKSTREASAVAFVLLLVLPLVWHGWRTHFVKSSHRYSELPGGMNMIRTIAIPQEFLVARSFGPTPDEVRRLPAIQAVRNKSIEISIEIFTILCILGALVASSLSSGKIRALRAVNNLPVRAIGFIIAACVVQVLLLVLLTGYRMNARHVAFLFGPLFILGVMPIAFSYNRIVKVVFLVPLFFLWTWSCGNQIFDSSYGTDDYRSAAKVLKSEEDKASRVIALCNPNALRYYGVEKAIIHFPESPDVTIGRLTSHLTDGLTPVWVVLNRPWNYPAFDSEKLPYTFLLLRTEQFVGIKMWLLAPTNKES